MREIFEQYGLEEINSSQINFEDKSQKYYNIAINLVEDVKLKTTRVLVIIKYLIGSESAIGKIIQSSPSIFDLVEGKFGLEFNFLFQSSSTSAKIKDRISLSDEISSVKVQEMDRETAKKLVERTESEVQIQKDVQEFKKATKISNIRVEVNKLDELMEVIGELLINTKQLQEATSQNKIIDTKNQIQVIQNLVLILQETILQMQLVPVNMIFRRFPRMMRSLSQQENKDVKLTITGAEMLVDRKILDEVNEALVHLLRNAVSHGIESSRERIAKKKSEGGNIILTARQEKNMLAIDVTDDGKGIDPEKVKATALEQGLISEGEAEHFTQADAFNIISTPGFSTMRSDEISEVSGRGMGVNIVREKVEKLGGILNISSEVGLGTTFTMLLPLSMSIIKALLVRVGSEKFSIPLDDVQYIYHLNSSEIQDVNGVKFVNKQGANIPLYDLSRIFNIETSNKQQLLDQQFVNVVLIERGNRKFGLAVEEFLEQTEIVVKKIEELTKHVKGVSGATILANGAVSLILDPFTIVSS
ncbi:MAG: CheA signal transduction histidine kinase [Promethearchaeota archaeon CR_4]|nr:MAG: CheA signal transduction histidine kinase [Candidatus Lokiarchaeota archaeon CR_4]